MTKEKIEFNYDEFKDLMQSFVDEENQDFQTQSNSKKRPLTLEIDSEVPSKMLDKVHPRVDKWLKKHNIIINYFSLILDQFE